MKKVIQAVLVVLVLLTTTVMVQAVEVSYSFGIYDKYQSEYSGFVFDERVSTQGDISLSFANGLYTGIWFAKQIGTDTEDMQSDEIDFYLGISGEKEGLNFDLALYYYDFVPVLGGQKDNVWAPTFSVSKDFSLGLITTLSPFLKVEVVIPEDGSSFNGGTYVSYGASLDIQATEKNIISLSTYFTHDSGAYDADENIIFNQKVSLESVFGNYLISFPEIFFSDPLLSDTERSGEYSVGGSVSSSF